jgi:hypothetical protein
MSKKKTENVPLTPPVADTHKDPEAEIARRAYAIYESRNREDGRDLDDWLQAELELREAKDHTT